MIKQLFREIYGNSASITDTGEGFKLICRDFRGKMWKRSTYKTARGAKMALARTGEVGDWRTIKGLVTD